mmetsp:Transcript_17465/g.48225  ORF Transcript_17465/g.48225 Transcript_17465/m.48225 type:complete len:776 (+) Transcript_17465:65-2392(+)|eukprot:CAMPEP_0172381996 /NCGR_PEP_ID=MMETSP1060-20121228/71235_1 /TAXON_ID=37318 /ORGANISM="Pseudo-nitzschia pungens, Strain cf. cingulata" /LENGTH=775 /DNA_ID=CAMNT_0013109789 /DNA_START=1 /DNA_END=2328 /DNA_ORIENTATION=-
MKRVLGSRMASANYGAGKSQSGLSSAPSLSSSGSSNPSSTESSITLNVQVCARIRPVVKSEDHDTSQGKKRISFIPGRRKPGSSSGPDQKNGHHNMQKEGAFVAWDISGDSTTASQSDKTEKIQGRTHSYTLDTVFGIEATTHDIYDKSVASLVRSAMEGYNSTVLAYGQTSTGKTHTMTGKPKTPGLIPLCIRDCFRYVEESSSGEQREYLFRFSYLEIYKEHIRDLLSSSTSAPEPVRLFDGPQGLIIRGLREEVVTSPEKVFQLLRQGEKRRQVGATHMNQHSSRSHAIMRLKIESSSAINKRNETRVSLLTLVDLAGSESVRLNGGERREEGQYINKSLMALGQCVLGLSESSKKNGDKKTNRNHIPFRDSKLTRMLQSSLSGNARMLLICCISPLASHMEESHNTFKFATRAKRIEQTATIQTAGDKEETLLQTYRDEIEDLKKQLADAAHQKQKLLEEQREFQRMKDRHEQLQSPKLNNIKTNSDTMESTSEEIEELVEAIQKMEHLIIKSRSLQQQQNSRQFSSTSAAGIVAKNTMLQTIVSSENMDDVLDHVMESDRTEDLLTDDDPESTSNILKNNCDTKFSQFTSPTTSNTHKNITSGSTQNSTNTENELHSELTRIRGLLGSVLKKRGAAHGNVRKSLNFSSPARSGIPSRQILDQSLSDELNAGMSFEGNMDEGYGVNDEYAEEKKAELESLRMQLEQQERTTSLRKADSHFLQAQLEEKDKLLEEVSSLLEAVEQRQGELERENVALKMELNRLRDERGFEV